MRGWAGLGVLVVGLSVIGGCGCPCGGPGPCSVRAVDGYTLVGRQNFLSGYPAANPDGTINVVVEIPAGTTAKWEVGPDGRMEWEIKDGQRRVVQYLGYPANYGMVPRTLLDKSLGGDGDPLDVMLLGPAVPRGSVVPARPIGVLKFLDGGVRDDKLLAVSPDGPMAQVRSLQELDAKFPGASTIVRIWLANYKGPGQMVFQNAAGSDEARAVIDAAGKAYAQSRR